MVTRRPFTYPGKEKGIFEESVARVCNTTFHFATFQQDVTIKRLIILECFV